MLGRRGNRWRARVLGPLLLAPAASCAGNSTRVERSGRPAGAGGLHAESGGASGVSSGVPSGRGGTGGGESLGPEGKGGKTSCVVVDADTARTTLAELCGEPCLSAEEVVSNIEVTCRNSGPLARVFDGCGYVVIQYSTGLFGSTWVYDRDTGDLVGLSRFGDTEWGPCHRFVYEAGILPDCEGATTCHICPGEDESGVGGEGGASGTKCLPF